jgi:hypothetical protein
MTTDVINGNGIYSLQDNAPITGINAPGNATTGLDLGLGTNHPIKNLGDPLDPTPIDGSAKGTFSYLLHDRSVTAMPRPHKADSFILLSPGADGLYGTMDDIANFPANK